MSEGSLVLGADVGGTKTRIALGEFENGRPRVITEKIYASREHATLEAVVERFMGETNAPAVTGACFAVAGPVDAGRARLTNLPWQLDERELCGRFRFPTRLINDFAAAGAGIAHLEDADLVMLQRGEEHEHGERVVVGAGTGLGVALLTWSRDGYVVSPSEGGHSDFAPGDEVQDQLIIYLRREFGHVSYERVIAGPALPRIVQFLQSSGAEPSPALLEAMHRGDAAEAVTHFALERRDEIAVRALDIFVAAYGAFAGNMALVTLAQGGVYVAGGIAPKIASKLTDGTFMRSFAAKGRLRAVLEKIPVHVVMNPDVGMYGALAEAARAA